MERSTRSRIDHTLAVVALCFAVALAPMRGLAADASETKAKQLFGDAQKEYDLGHFDKALELYSEAYKLKPLPGFLFNIAQCHRQMGNWEQAGFFFGRFIDNSNPRTPNIEVARELLEDAHRKQAQAAEDARLADEKKKKDAEEDKRAQDELARRKTQEAVEDAQRSRQARESMALEQQQARPPPEDPVTKKAWFWVVLVGGLVAVAGGTTAAVLVATNQKPVPEKREAATLGEIGGAIW